MSHSKKNEVALSVLPRTWWLVMATGVGRVMLACVRLADKDGRVVLVCVRLVEEDGGFSGWQRPGPCRVGPRFQRSSSTSARRVQQNTGTQLLVEILQER